MQDRGPAAYIAEFIGTLLLVLFITAVGVAVRRGADARRTRTRSSTSSVIGLVHVFVLFVLIQTLAVVSGAHFNPAVTAAMTALRQIKPLDAVIYIVAQFAGAVAGALITKRSCSTRATRVELRRRRGVRRARRQDPPGHGRRGARHVLPRVGDHRRGREPARGQGVGRARDRRRAGHGA